MVLGRNVPEPSGNNTEHRYVEKCLIHLNAGMYCIVGKIHFLNYGQYENNETVTNLSLTAGPNVSSWLKNEFYRKLLVPNFTDKHLQNNFHSFKYMYM